MSNILIQRYLGNKGSITSEIVEVIASVAKPNDLVFDAFAGSLAVSVALRNAGFQVACCDINHFSWVFGKAYLANSKLPKPKLGLGSQRNSWPKLVCLLTDSYDKSIPVKFRRTDFFDNYCEEGSRSAFTSKRGSVGRRRFFSSENARLIDRALSRIRFWHLSSLIDESTRCLLLSALLSAVEKVSNTQGTYHDFPRHFVDERALKPLKISPPDPSRFMSPASLYIGKAEDSLEYVRSIPKHRVMYLDPPYNFRQYTSYYFMLNLISLYPEIGDIDAFFGHIEFVRGQNMSTDFKSTFCSRGSFIPSLRTLVERANCEFVVMSYFDGPNHWGEFKASSAEENGKAHLEDFFCSSLFVKGSLRCLPVARMNYQSYGGHRAKPIREFLFLARKRNRTEARSGLGASPWIGRVLV